MDCSDASAMQGSEWWLWQLKGWIQWRHKQKWPAIKAGLGSFQRVTVWFPRLSASLLMWPRMGQNKEHRADTALGNQAPHEWTDLQMNWPWQLTCPYSHALWPLVKIRSMAAWFLPAKVLPLRYMSPTVLAEVAQTEAILTFSNKPPGVI